MYICCLFFISIIMFGHCMPPFSSWVVHESIVDGKYQNTLCTQDNDTDNLCQLCTKKSMSPKAYSMCCDPNDETGAKAWCERYVSYPFQPSVS
ncbi:hypothetical protein WDU94_007928 [Cyamophila willieti]